MLFLLLFHLNHQQQLNANTLCVCVSKKKTKISNICKQILISSDVRKKSDSYDRFDRHYNLQKCVRCPSDFSVFCVFLFQKYNETQF